MKSSTATLALLALLLILLGFIALSLDRIAYQAKVSNCLTMARAGYICAALARKP